MKRRNALSRIKQQNRRTWTMVRGATHTAYVLVGNLRLHLRVNNTVAKIRSNWTNGHHHRRMEHRRHQVAQPAFIGLADRCATIVRMLGNTVLVAALVVHITGQQDSKQQRHAETGGGVHDPGPEHGAKIMLAAAMEGSERFGCCYGA